MPSVPSDFLPSQSDKARTWRIKPVAKLVLLEFIFCLGSKAELV